MPVNDSIASEQWYRYRWMVERGHYQFLEKAYKCDQFFAGQQWEQADLNALKLAKRPAMTINKILSTVGTIMGEQIYNRSEVIYRPQNGAPSSTAESLTKLWMNIAQNNQLPWVRSDVFADGIIRSRGFYDVRMRFNDSMQGDIEISQLNSKNVIIDPDAEEYDPDFWNDVIISKWVTPMDIALLYSEEDAEYFKTKSESSFPYAYDSIERVRDRFAGPYLTNSYYGVVDSTFVRRNVRLLERQYKQMTKQKHFVDIRTGEMRPVPDAWDRERIGALLAKTNGQVNVINKLVKRIRWTVTADNLVLHDDWSPYKHFTVVPYFPHFRSGTTIGIVENLLGPQEILNKVSSQELHIVNTTANSGWKVKAGALRNMSLEELEQSGAQTGLVLELDEINNAEKIQPNQTPTGLDRVSYKAEEHIKTISNVSDSMQGFDREDVAAKAIAYKQQRGSVNMTKVLDNLERTDFILARNALDLIQTYYTEQRIINITHDDILRAPEQLTINELNPETGEIMNDLTLGEYSITITSQPYRATMEDSQFEQARALREIGVAIPDSVLIENSRLQRKADIVKQMAGDKESPEAQAQAALELRAKEAEVANLEGDAAKKHAAAGLDVVRAKKEQQEAQGGPDAEAQAKIREVELEFELKREAQEREFELKQRALDQEMEFKREAHALDMQQRREQHAQQMNVQRARSLIKPAAKQDNPSTIN